MTAITSTLSNLRPNHAWASLCGILDEQHASSLLRQGDSIQKILTSIVKTTSENPYLRVRVLND